MPCSAKFLMTLQTKILSTESSDFLKQIVFCKSFNSVLHVISKVIVVVVLLFNIHSKQLWSCRNGQLT